MTEADTLRVAGVQMTSGRSIDDNLSAAERLAGEAVSKGAQLVVLPENFSFMGADDAERVSVAEAEGAGPAQEFAAQLSRRHALWLVAGTIPIRCDDGRVLSRSYLYGPEGDAAGYYDKIHLFDVDLPASEGESYRESRTTRHGQRVVSVPIGRVRLGMAVCYDLRFPGMFARLAEIGMDLLALPAAFTVPTGQVHWQPLLQARAIESLVYVVASGQSGQHPGGRKTYGHSMIVGPWGEILAECPDGPGIVCADVDMIRLQRLRRQFPVLQHRRDLN